MSPSEIHKDEDEARVAELRTTIKKLKDDLRIEQNFGRNMFDRVGVLNTVVRAARALIAAPHCKREYMSFGHDTCSLGQPCDVHCWHMLRHAVFLVDNPDLEKYKNAYGNVICPNCQAQNGHTTIGDKECPGYP